MLDDEMWEIWYLFISMTHNLIILKLDPFAKEYTTNKYLIIAPKDI